MKLQQKDIKLISLDKKVTLFLHIPTLQIYPLSDNEAIDFLSTFQKIGPKKSLLKFGEEKYNYYYSGITEIIKKSPKLSSLDISNLQEVCIFNTIVLPISGHCTLKCPYCFAQTDGQFKFQDYTTEQAEKAIDFAINNRTSQNTKEPLCITFFGGEPLLRVDIIEHAINYVKQKYPSETVTYSITTNGTILNDKIINIFKENHFAVLVSIDGPDNEYNLRVDHQGNKCVSKVLDFINALKENNIYTELRATLINTNPYIVQTFDFFEKLELPFFISFAYASENKEHNYSNYDNDILQNIHQQFDDLLKYYLEKFKKRENIYSKQLSTHFNILRFRRNNHLACGAGRTYFSITADGSIFACTHFINDKKHAIGNIADGVIDKSKYEPIAIEKIKECANCWAKYFCLGHCPAQKISMGKSNISACPENECELEKLQVELYIKLFYYAKKYLPKSSKK